MIHILKIEQLRLDEIKPICLDRTIIHVHPIYADAATIIVKQILASYLAKYGATSEVSEEERGKATQKMIDEGKYMIRFFINSTLEEDEFIITTTNKANQKQDVKK